LPANTTIAINVVGFDLIAANNNFVTFNGGGGTVSKASTTLLTVAFSTKPVTAMTAVVTTDGVGPIGARNRGIHRRGVDAGLAQVAIEHERRPLERQRLPAEVAAVCHGACQLWSLGVVFDEIGRDRFVLGRPGVTGRQAVSCIKVQALS